MTDKQYSAHEWLNEAYWLEKTELKIKQEFADRLKPEGGVVDYSKDRIQNNNNTSAQEERLNSYSMACAEVDKVKVKIERIRRIRYRVIESVSKQEYRDILIARYLNQNRPLEIAKLIKRSERDYYRQRDKALDEVFELIKEFEGGETKE